MIIIEVAETAERHGMFQAMLDGNIIVASSVTPFLDAARVLLAQGVDSDELLVMRHHSVDSLRAKIGTAAKLESQAMVSDSDLRPIGPKRHWCVETVAGLFRHRGEEKNEPAALLRGCGHVRDRQTRRIHGGA